MSFLDKVVLITGASAGIGESAARKFAAQGARVVLAARGVERLERVADSIRSAGGEALPIAADIGDDASCDQLLEQTMAAHGGIDVLVNNAGLHHRGHFSGHSAKALADMVTVNLRSPVYLTRLALGPMLAEGRGTIVNVASLAGCVPLPEAAVYSSTKFGLRALSLALAEELRGTGVRVSVVSPGPVTTGFIMDDLDEVSDIALSQPLSTADEVADQILACAADGRPERKLPWASGKLATLAYLVPPLARGLRPIMAKRGAMVKRKLRREAKA